MRHTLLPINERKALRREYRVRLLIVLCFLLCTAGVVGIGALFPAYLRATMEEKTQLDSAARLKRGQDAQGYTAIQDELKSDNKILMALSKDTRHIRISAVLGSIISLRQAVHITSFGFAEPSTTTVAVDMGGRASSRADLLSFKGRLESALPGAKVDLPIAELAKSANIDWTMKITYKAL